MPGDDWQKRANFRLLIAYMCAHPGKKLLFMGTEFGQRQEWREYDQLDWLQLQDLAHLGLRDCARELNQLYRATPQFHASDCDHEGFRWLDLHNAGASVWAFQRRSVGQDTGAPIICIFNATPVPRDQYPIGVEAGEYRKVFDSDDAKFGGSGYNMQTRLGAVAEAMHGYDHTLRINLPPLGAVFFTLS
jgi:1,4-alpha-glucan branching enzyme